MTKGRPAPKAQMLQGPEVPLGNPYNAPKMKWTFLLVALVTGAICGQAQQPAPDIRSENARIAQIPEFRMRDGLPNLFHRIATHRQVVIGYLGGSITEAEQGWRQLTFDWFRLQYPETAFYQVNGTIGGTASDLGVFRTAQDILSGKPDLVFVEFAVNDHDEALQKETIRRSMEGIVRKIWSALPETDICFIYTTSESICRDMLAGKPNYAIGVMEEVAAHYGIPSINLTPRIARLYTAGKLVLSGNPADNDRIIVFTRDHTHPLPESGHPLYGSVVVRHLEEMVRPKSRPGAHRLPAPIDQENWVRAKMVDLDSLRLSGRWTKLPPEDALSRSFSKFMPVIYKGSPGAVISFRYRGSVLGFFDCIGPGTGRLEVTIDGQTRSISRFDTYCTYFRKNYFIIDDIPEGLHRVEIRVLADTLNKPFILGKHLAEMGNPASYRFTDWYPSRLMILGEMAR